jgi:hypothetical protein
MKLICAIIFGVIGFGVPTEDDWKHEKFESGITAYSRLKAGKEYYEFRTTCTVASDLNKVIQSLSKINNFKNWLPNTKESRILKKVDSTVLYGYTVTSTQWPLSDRDLVFKMTHKKINENNYHIILHGEEDFYPEQPDKVRLKDYYSVWKLKKVKAGVFVEHTSSFYPGSGAPYWALKNAIINARVEVCKALRKKVKTE